MKKIIGIVLLALAPAFIVPAIAQTPAVITSDKAGWHKIGETTASLQSDRDEIYVLGKDRFKSLKLKVTDQPLFISSMVIYYESGATEDVSIDADFKAGKESRVINLKSSREIKKVSLVYKTAANAQNEKAHVELWGLK